MIQMCGARRRLMWFCMEMSHNRSFMFDLIAVWLTYDNKCTPLLYEHLKCAKPSFPFLHYLFFSAVILHLFSVTLTYEHGL